jgi:hypothetical protein
MEQPRVDRCFVWAGRGDGDGGGFIVAETIRNLRICLEEKWTKIQPSRSRYPIWWLVLEDHLHYQNALDAGDVETIRGELRGGWRWDRVLLFNARTLQFADYTPRKS